MTAGEKAIYKTVRSNMRMLEEKGKILVQWSTVSDKAQFKEALESIKKKGLITYEISFLTVIIVLTGKGKQRLKAGDPF